MTTDLWSEHYQRDSLQSSTAGFPDAVRQSIETRWRTQFASVPNRTTILDVGTGRGALLRLAADCASEDHRLSVVGVDLAELNWSPDFANEHCDITLEGEMDLGQMPYADSTFGLVVSQYSLEYAGFESALSECARLTSDALMLLVHAAEGVVVRQNGGIAEQVGWLLNDQKLESRLREYVTKPGEQTASELKLLADNMILHGRTLENPAFLESLTRNIGQFLQHFDEYSNEENLNTIDGFIKALRNQASRMRALERASRSRGDMERAANQLRESGMQTVEWDIEAAGPDDAPQIVGYWLRGSRT